MNKIAYIVAVATFAALLLIISAPGGMAAEPSGDMNPSMGAPQGQGGQYQSGPSSQAPQGYSPGSKQMGEGAAGQGGIAPGPSERRTSGSDQGPSSGRSGYGQPAQSGSPGQQGSAGGEGIVMGVDRPDNCLRIRKGPSSQYEQVGCANMGDKLRLTGVFSNDNRWAQLDSNGWVFVCQIKTDLKPPSGSFACGRPRGGGGSSYEMWSGPASYGEGYISPGYYSGFGSGWYGGHRWRHHGGHHGGGHHGGHHGGGHHGGGHHKK